jgi:hypothetical protein
MAAFCRLLASGWHTTLPRRSRNRLGLKASFSSMAYAHQSESNPDSVPQTVSCLKLLVMHEVVQYSACSTSGKQITSKKADV